MKELIYDVGMNNGDDTAYYLAKGFRVIAIEADALLVEQASHRFEQEISTGKLIILNVGISDREGAFPFYICDANPEWSTLDAMAAEDKGVVFRQVEVSCRRFRSILDEFGTPCYLKLDIEGNEIYCLRDLISPDLPSYVSFEKTAKSSVESLTLLHNLGYTGFKLITQDHYFPVEYPPGLDQRNYERKLNFIGGSFFVRVIRKAGGFWLKRLVNPTRYRADWIFPLGSSGPFGEDTPGKWQTFDEMLETLLKANSSFAAREPSVLWGGASYSFWADFHAKRNE